MSKYAMLRVCASCEWIFKRDKETDQNGCPKCLFGHYGARYVYGRKAYRYAQTQKPWLGKKMAEHGAKLLSEIAATNKNSTQRAGKREGFTC